MSEKPNFDYYYGDESNQFSFYRIPRQLITGPPFRKLSTDAKLLYGLLLDRMGLSAKNGWYDEAGRVYIYYTLDEIRDDLNCGHDKAVKLLAELDTGKGFGLIERIKQGQGRPTKIYVKRFTTREKPTQPVVPQDTPRLPISRSQDFGKAEVKSSDNQKSKLRIFGSADFGKSDANYIKSIHRSQGYRSHHPRQARREQKVRRAAQAGRRPQGYRDHSSRQVRRGQETRRADQTGRRPPEHRDHRPCQVRRGQGACRAAEGYGCDSKQPQVLLVDGYKVTIRYSTQKNPSAIKAIKDTLLANVAAKQS